MSRGSFTCWMGFIWVFEVNLVNQGEVNDRVISRFNVTIFAGFPVIFGVDLAHFGFLFFCYWFVGCGEGMLWCCVRLGFEVDSRCKSLGGV